MTKPRRRKPGEKFVSEDRLPPALDYVSKLEGEYFRLSEVAQKVQVSDQTLRKLIRAEPPKVKAPSYVGRQGNMNIYLFTAEDVEEIRAYFHNKYEDFEAPRGRGRPKKKVS